MTDEMQPETQARTNGHHSAPAAEALTRLSVNDAPFLSTGTATIRVTRQGKAVDLAIPIKAVDLDAIRVVLEPRRPKIPTYREKVQNRWVTVFDEANDGYQQSLEAFQRRLARTIVLYGLDLDITDATDHVLWARDNSTCDYDAAVQALRDMGFVENHWIGIMRAVSDLTQIVEDEYARD